MKVFRDIFAAILVGVIGGILVSTVSYYNNHQEGGLLHTLFAVVNSYDTIADAYATTDDMNLKLSEQNYDMDEVLKNENALDEEGIHDDETESVLNADASTDKELGLAMQDVFEEIKATDLEAAAQAVLGAVLPDSDGENDILIMDDEDGNLEEGAPYSGIMRFHVRANSDSEEDQELKMAVKEDVVTFLKPLLEECDSVAESKNVIVSNMQNIYEVAINTIVEQGYDYNVKVYVTKEEFPAKTYGDLTFPAGEYQALRIDIGEAKGQNWWCVIYPPLCFIDESTMVVSQEGKELLKDNMTQAEYAELFADSEVKAESWFWNWLFGEEE